MLPDYFHFLLTGVKKAEYSEATTGQLIDPKTRDHLITTSRSLVAVDVVGVGEGQFVLAVQGSSARMTPETKALPVDCTIIGVIDSITMERQNLPLE